MERHGVHLPVFEHAVRGHLVSQAFEGVGHDVTEAAEAWSRAKHAAAEALHRATEKAKELGKGKRAPTAVEPAAPAQVPSSVRFSVKGLPKPVRHLLAGAFSAGVSKTATAPIETVRMKLMTGAGKGKSILDVVAATWRAGAVPAFFAGNMADVVRTAPQKAIQLAAFDAYKKLFSRDDPSKPGRKVVPGWASTLCGAAAGVTSTITCFPLEVLRTRLCCSEAGAYHNMFDALSSIVRKEGPRALFGGLGPSVAGVVPYAGINLGMYDALRLAYTKTTGEERVPKTAALVIGALSGVTAATCTFPLEVVRRRMMMGAKYANTLAALAAISKAEGTGALFKGCALNWVKLAPSAGLGFYVYEVAKDGLGLVEAVKPTVEESKRK